MTKAKRICFASPTSKILIKKNLLNEVVLIITGMYLLCYVVPCFVSKYSQEHRAILYDETMDIIFIGGVARSGTSLMSALLDAHPEVRCGEETTVIPDMLAWRREMDKHPSFKEFLTEAKISRDILDAAVQTFILEIIAKQGKAAPHLCNKESFALEFDTYLSTMFPKSRYILMVRDGRAVAHSIISRVIDIKTSNYNSTIYLECLQIWNQAVESMYGHCLRVGPYRCMPVYYERLVLHPEVWMRRILGFLDIAWSDSVLHHDNDVGKTSMPKRDKLNDEVFKPVNSDALFKWVGSIPDDVVKDMANIAPMLKTLGYDPDANPPNYGESDSEHLQKSKA